MDNSAITRGRSLCAGTGRPPDCTLPFPVTERRGGAGDEETSHSSREHQKACCPVSQASAQPRPEAEGSCDPISSPASVPLVQAWEGRAWAGLAPRGARPSSSKGRCQPGPPLTLPTVCNRKEVRCRKEHISSLMYETVAARLVSQKALLWSSCEEERVTSGPQQGTRAYFHLWG